MRCEWRSAQGIRVAVTAPEGRQDAFFRVIGDPNGSCRAKCGVIRQRCAGGLRIRAPRDVGGSPENADALVGKNVRSRRAGRVNIKAARGGWFGPGGSVPS